MRYRALSVTRDSTFGSGSTAFLINNAQAVAQAITTRLLLMTGEWFLDLTEGTPYSTQIIGKGTTALYDAAIKNRILGTLGVLSIISYSSSLNRATRDLVVNATVNTIFGAATLTTPVPILNMSQPGIPSYAITDTGQPGVTDSGSLMTVN